VDKTQDLVYARQLPLSSTPALTILNHEISGLNEKSEILIYYAKQAALAGCGGCVCIPNILDAKAGGLRVGGQAGLQSKF
jgi:hypothetical protein